LFKSKHKFIASKKPDIEKKLLELQNQLELASKAFLSAEELDLAIQYVGHFGGTKILAQRLKDAKEFNSAKVKVGTDETNILILKLKEELAGLENSKLCHLITRENINSLFCENKHTAGNNAETCFDEIKGSDYFDLLKFLLREGLIDESYPDYMTYFYPQSLTRGDKVFLRSVADKKPQSERYSLDEPGKVIGRLSAADFEQPETLNLNLMHYMLTHGYEAYAQKLLDQLKTRNNIVFVNDYLQFAGNSLIILVIKLNITWPSFFKSALTATAFQANNRILWARTTLRVSKDETIKAVNEDNCLSNFISETPEFLDGEPLDQSKLIHGMQLIGVEMKAICREKANADLLKAVYERKAHRKNLWVKTG
jgi:hypothetical protein